MKKEFKLVIVNERGPARRSVVEERMLQSREEMNVGKEALKEGVILYGYENYWKTVGDAIG